jgi:hypothetical protein
MKFVTFFLLLVVVNATGLSAVYAQEPRSEKKGTGGGTVGVVERFAHPEEPAIYARGLGQSDAKMTSPAAVVIGNWPADLFASRSEARRVETGYPTAIPRRAASKDMDSDNTHKDLAALAKDFLNPVSALASVSFRNTLDYALAADREGWRYRLDFEPAFSISLNKNWRLISRTTLPLLQQDGIIESTTQTALGDILQTVFLAPKKTGSYFWGGGAAILLPTATDTQLGRGKLGFGPTLTVGKQQGDWTYGVLARQLWSVAGHRDRADVRTTFVQPFLAYTTKTAWSYSLNTESVYDWAGKQWSVPIHLEVSKVVLFVRQPVRVGLAARCWAATIPGGPPACGFRFIASPLFSAR